MSNIVKTFKDPETIAKQEFLNTLINQDPQQAHIRDNNGVKYIPIGYIENMLTQIFVSWRVELLDYKVIFNSVAVSIRLHYLNPVTNDWSYQDGIGAMDVQVEKGCSPADLSKIKHGAIQKGLPSAMNYAVKNAAKRLGKFFGRDLNRKDKAGKFAAMYSDRIKEILGEETDTDETA